MQEANEIKTAVNNLIKILSYSCASYIKILIKITIYFEVEKYTSLKVKYFFFCKLLRKRKDLFIFFTLNKTKRNRTSNLIFFSTRTENL